MYFYLILNIANPEALDIIIWSVKALSLVQVLVIWLVQCMYIWRIWRISTLGLTSTRLRMLLQIGIVLTIAIILGVGTVLVLKLFQLQSFIHPPSFSWAIYMAFGTTIVVDTSIASTMVFVLYRSCTGIRRMDSVIFTLIQYIVSTGLLTSLASLLLIIMFSLRPHSLLYFGINFSVTRLYANSFIAMCNSRQWLRGRLNATLEVNVVTSVLIFDQEREEGGAWNRQKLSVCWFSPRIIFIEAFK